VSAALRAARNVVLAALATALPLIGLAEVLWPR
jgi:hypothetical protein